MPTSNSAIALEKSLRLWEDYQFELFMIHEFGLGKEFHQYSDFEGAREYLLSYRPGMVLDERFFRDERASRRVPGPFYTILQWVANSRRVFRLSSEMQEAFSKIDPGNVLLSDLVAPFPAFAIELATPIAGSSLLMVLRINEFARWRWNDPSVTDKPALYMVNNTMGYESYPALDPKDKREALGLLRSGNRQAALRKIRRMPLGRTKEWTEKMLENSGSGAVIFRAGGGDSGSHASDLSKSTAADLVSKYTSMGDETTARSLRIFLNLLVYLDALPDKVREVEGKVWNKEKQDTGPLKGVITDVMRVCEIGSRHILDSMIKDERTPAERASGHVVTPHWRRAHKRRAPGQGNNPLAEKTVRVRHTLVLGSKMPERGVPVGSMGVVKR